MAILTCKQTCECISLQIFSKYPIQKSRDRTNPPDLPTLKAYPTPGVGGRFGFFSLKWRERINLKVPGAILPLGCAILSTRAKTVRGVGRRTRVKGFAQGQLGHTCFVLEPTYCMDFIWNVTKYCRQTWVCIMLFILDQFSTVYRSVQGEYITWYVTVCVLKIQANKQISKQKTIQSSVHTARST